MDRDAYVYIMAGNAPETGKIPLYIGSTTDLPRRAWEHRNGHGSDHTRKYRIRRLIWYQRHESIESAKTTEYRMKRWTRAKKDELITKFNPNWRDLYDELA